MQGNFGPQRDPHQDWQNRLEEGAYEQWKANRGRGSGGGFGQAIAWIFFLGFIVLIILFFTSGT